jgi:serine protease Do
MARDVMRQLIAGGRVVRGWLGIVIQDVTDELAKSFGVAEREGVLVAQVMDGGPADAAGLKSGDVIVEFAGTPIKETPELQRRVAAVSPGQPVEMRVKRDGQLVTLRVSIGEMPSDDPSAAAVEPPDESWGLRVEPLSAELAQRFGLGRAQGVVVADLVSEGPAEHAGLKRGDVILEIEGRPVTDVTMLYRELGRAGQGARLYVFRHGAEGTRQFVMLERRPKP